MSILKIEGRQRSATTSEISRLDHRELWNQHGSDFLTHVSGVRSDGASIRNVVLFPRMENLMGEINTNTVILDAGCGNSVLGNRLRVKTQSIFEFDIVPSFLSSDNGKNKQVFVADMTNTLPLSKEHFDLVVSNLNLMWIPDIKIFAKEAFRVLKPKGRLVFSITHPFVNLGEWNNDDFANPELLLRHPVNTGIFLKMIAQDNGPYLYYQRPQSEYINTFTEEGLTLIPKIGCEEVFVTDEELRGGIADYTQRHQSFPLFLILGFEKGN